MKIVLQRVSSASVSVDFSIVGKIEQGFLLLLGVSDIDTIEDIDYLVSKICKLRVFNDSEGKMNLDINDIGGSILVISQFTLFANTKKGNRPSFIEAGKPEKAQQFYDLFCEKLSIYMGKKVEKGIFGADMKVSLVNDGPVTIVFDTQNKG